MEVGNESELPVNSKKIKSGPVRSDYENPHPRLLSHREEPHRQPVITLFYNSAGD